MPNWTTNHIRIRHDNKSLIDAIMATDGTDKGVLDTIIPCPPELNDTDLTTWSHGEEQAAREKKQAEMVAKYGYKSWYDWNIAHWGTKWDLCEPQLTRVDDNTVEISCQTAWSPPIAAFETMTGLGYDVRCLYLGEGCEYAGIWEEGNDEYYNLTDGSKDAAKKLPQELDEFFNIVEQMEEWERENEEELTQWIREGVEERNNKPVMEDE